MSCRSTTGSSRTAIPEEEVKLRDPRGRKILEILDLPVSGTCVRVPVYSGHSLFDQCPPNSIATFRCRWRSSCCARRRASCSPTCRNPLEATGRDEVFVGRVRRDPTVKHGLALFVCGDNLRKGGGAERRCRSPSCCRRAPLGPQAARARLGRFPSEGNRRTRSKRQGNLMLKSTAKRCRLQHGASGKALVAHPSRRSPTGRSSG